MTSFSVITSINPPRLSKGFSLGADGQLEKSPGGNLVIGDIEFPNIAKLGDLASILTSLGPTQALTYGIPKNSATRVASRKMFERLGRPSDHTTRTNDAFKWPEGGGVMMLDYDPPSGGTPLAEPDLVNALREAAPGLVSAELLWFPSASSCIFHNETELHGIKGQRLYLLVKDASDIPRAGKLLIDRLWLAGRGYIQISKSGALLPRTLVDANVWQACRLDFAGGADCTSPLKQDRGEPVLIPGSACSIDTHVALPDLTEDEAERLRVVVLAAREAKTDEAKAARAKWVEERARAMLPTADVGNAEKLAQAEEVALGALDKDLLSGDFQLKVEIDGSMQTVTVSEILIDRQKYHGLHTCDPLEPEYDDGRLVGELFLLQAKPGLHSFARGGKGYRLQKPPARIEIVQGHVAEAASKAIDLMRFDPALFDLGGQLVLADDGRVCPLDEHGLAHHFGDVVQFYETKLKKGGTSSELDCNAPRALLQQILAIGDRRKLKTLVGIITGPTVRLDGTVLDMPGYDVATGLLFDLLDGEVNAIPERPTQDEARTALAAMMHPFVKFPFCDARAKGALLAALLTATVRCVLPTSPAFAFDAPTQGSGKTLLALCVGALAEGEAPAIWPHTTSRDDEETRKRLFTALRAGSRSILWDNITGTFDSPSMAAFITAPSMKDRVLGKSEEILVPNRALLLLTGNNICLAGDLPRRVIICRIDPGMEVPISREFDLDPLAYVIEHRIEMLTAACVLIRARMTSSASRAPGKMASFEPWDALVRQTVCWVNDVLEPGAFGDPMELVREAQEADPDRETLSSLLEALKSKFAQGWFTAKEVKLSIESVFGDTPIRLALNDILGEKNSHTSKSIGRVLKYREGRVANGLRLDGRQDSNANARMYRVVNVEETNPINPASAPESSCSGYGGFAGSNSGTPCRENSGNYTYMEGGENSPSNPSNPNLFGSEDREPRKIVEPSETPSTDRQATTVDRRSPDPDQTPSSVERGPLTESSPTTSSDDRMPVPPAHRPFDAEPDGVGRPTSRHGDVS